MSIKFDSTEIHTIKYNGINLTEVIINGVNVWNSYFTYTLLDDNTYSVAPRKISATGGGFSEDTRTPDGYLCGISVVLDDAKIDTTSSTLSATIKSYLGFKTAPSVSSISGGTIYVVGYASSANALCSVTIEVSDMPEEVVIPSTFNGKAVTKIGANAFKDYKQIKKLVIPDSVTTWKGAFSGCTNLETLTLSFTDTDGGDTQWGTTLTLGMLFGGSSENDNPDYVPNSLSTVIVRGDFIPSNAFWNCTNLDKVYISSSVTTIRSTVFLGCTSLKIYCEAASKQSKWNDTWNYITLDGTKLVPTYYSVSIPT